MTKPNKIIIFLAFIMAIFVGARYWVYIQMENIDDASITNITKTHTGLDISFKEKSFKLGWVTASIKLHDLNIIYTDNPEFESIRVDSLELSFNLLHSLLQQEAIIETIVLEKPNILYNSGDTKKNALAIAGIASLIQNDIANFLHNLPDFKNIIVSKGQVSVRGNDKIIELLFNTELNIKQFPGTTQHDNRIYKLSMGTNIAYAYLLMDKVHLSEIVTKDLRLTISSKIEYVQNEAIVTSIDFKVNNLAFKWDEFNGNIQEAGAKIHSLQELNDYNIKFSEIYIIKDKKKLDLNALFIQLKFDNKAITLIANSKQLQLNNLIQFVGLPTDNIKIGQFGFDFTNLSLTDMSFKKNLMRNDDGVFFAKLSHLIVKDLENDIQYKLTKTDLELSKNDYKLNLKEAYYHLPGKICKQSLRAHPLQGQVNIKNQNDELRISFPKITTSICKIDINLAGSLISKPDTAPYIDANATFIHQDISMLLSDITDKFVSKNLLKWFKQSLPSQNPIKGDLKIAGDIDKFPFDNHSGTFIVNANLKNITFDFDKDWGRARHTNAHINVTNGIFNISLHGGMLGENNIESATTSFGVSKNLEDLIVDLKVNGKIDNLLNYLSKTPLKDDIPKQTQFAYHGDARLDLKLRIPLEEHVTDEIEGTVKIENGNIYNLKTNLKIVNDFVGDISIIKGDVKSRTYLTKTNRDFNLTIDGKTKVEFLQPSTKESLKYDADVKIAYTSKDSDNWHWNITSELDNQRHNISGIEQNKLVGISKAKILGEISSKRNMFKLQGLNGLFVTYDETTKGETKDIQIGIKKANHSYFAFYSFIKDALNMDEMSNLDEQKLDFKITDLDIYANVFKKMDVIAEFKGSNVYLAISGEKNEGNIVYFRNHDTWMMDFKSLSFERKDSGMEFDSFMYQNHANLKAKIDKLNINNADMGQFDIQYNPRLEKEVYRVNDQEIELKKSEYDKYNLTIEIYSNNFNNFLKEFGLDSKIKAKSGEIDLKFQWPLTKNEITFNDLSIDISLNLSDGRLNIDTGISGGTRAFGKMISLLNIAAIPRRLTLDFKDVTTSDFVFDKVLGNITLNDSIYHTSNLEIGATSAAYGLQGSLDYKSETIDAKLSVMPKLTGGIPVVAAVVAGPIVGLAALAANTLVGDSINELSIKRFKISGSLDDIQVVEIDSKSKKKKDMNKKKDVKKSRDNNDEIRIIG